METVRIDIAYRPLRIAWAVRSDDLNGLRRAVRFSHALWGGQFNPIVLADKPNEAGQLIEVFRVDFIWPIGESTEVQELPKKFPHLINPLMGSIFSRYKEERGRAHALDIHNALVHWRNSPAWKDLEARGIRQFVYESDDPLADVFLMRLGAYPDGDDIGIDYSQILSEATVVVQEQINRTQPIPVKVLEHPNIGYLTRHGISRHHSIRAGWNYPGFFVGDATNTADLVAFWNLRAADIPLHFVDPEHIARYTDLIPEYSKRVRADLLQRFEHDRNVAIWARNEIAGEAAKLFEGEKISVCRIGDGTWNGLNVRAPMMMLGQESSLGVLGSDHGKPRVSFALKDKPYSSDVWFFSQHLVASVSLIGGLYGDDHHTFRLPYVPELNEFFARSMHYDYDKLRVEPERVGLITNAADDDSFLNALSIGDLVEKVFDLTGLRAKLSGGGLITRQLISRLGGIRNARVFKIPGVRRLLKTHGPTATFTKSAALGLIAGKDPNNPTARFSDYETLHIEPREERRLTPQMVFGHLVANGLFRIGAELTCSTCRLSNWIALDSLKQRVTCDLCGSEYDATRQLVDGVFHYRRTGVLGLEKNTQGAVPVTLVLEQLTRNLWGIHHDAIYTPSYDLTPKDGIDLPTCEVDFVMILSETYPEKASIILGESKDASNIDSKDIENLTRIADAIPRHRFNTYVALTKLVPFTTEEIELAKTLNRPHERRVIMLTADELEPYRLYDRTSKDLGIDRFARSAKQLAENTHKTYFTTPAQTKFSRLFRKT